ncbi:MAG: hypothetical protein H0Z38_09655 [Firmicutes bacterium]|nr:hypothetical protein [Bacillota bacterium]
MKMTVIRLHNRRKGYQITSLFGWQQTLKTRPKWKRFLDRCCMVLFGGGPRGFH